MTQKVKIKFKNMLIFVMTFALVAASVPLTGFAAAERHETQTEQETQEQEKESGTEKGTEGTTEKQETKAETEKKAEKGTEKESGAETESKAQTESGKQTEPEPGKKPEKKTAGKPKKLMLKVEGEATASVYYGVSDFDKINHAEGVREGFTDSYELDLDRTKDGRFWMYVQAYGDNTEYLGLDEPEDVSHSIVRSMDGVGGFEFFAFDASGLEKEGEEVTVRFGEKPSSMFQSRAASGFNTTSTKKLTGLTFNYEGIQPTMYQKKPATGESQVWGNGTWTIERPTITKLCDLFGVSKPDGARYTNVGVDENGKIYMRCSGVANISGTSAADGGHAGLGNNEAYIRCIDIEESDTSTTYTFRLWAANGGRGQTTEGYIQITTYTPNEDEDIAFEKTIKSKGSIKDILDTESPAGKAGARFRVYKVNSAGLGKIAARLNTGSKSDSEWWAGITSKEDCKKILPEVVKLMSKDNAKPGEKSPNPNDDYFSMVGAYATGANGRTEKIPIKSGTKDYYMVFERRSPEGLNMGYDGNDGVPEGSHYFYKAFTVYGDGKILMLNAKGDYSLDGGDDMVTIGDAPVLSQAMVWKKLIGADPASLGLGWKDFAMQISDNAGFTGHVVSVPLTGEYTTIPRLFVSKIYYLREDPNAKAVTSNMGYEVSREVYSFYVREDGKAVYSNTNKANIQAPDAVDASAHTYIGEEKGGIPNESDNGSAYLVKVSTLPAISDNNPCYSRAGAEYEIYRKATPTAPDSGGTKMVNMTTADGKTLSKLTTNAAGVSETVTLPVGYYYAKEVKAPKGFLLDSTPLAFRVTKGKTATINAEDKPGNDPIDILLRKDDSELDKNAPQGGAALAGAEYTIKYYAGYYTEEDLSNGDAPVAIRTWVYETDAEGYINMSRATPIRGDAVYRDEDKAVVIPVGTISIQETKAPDGYLLDETLHVQQVQLGENNERVIATNTKIVKEEPCRGDFKMLKIGDDGKILSDVPFKITSKTTGESHVIVTDEEGILDTSKMHSRNTNRGETAEDGVWFGEPTALDDEKGALLYDTYLIEEILCENNKDKFMIEPFEVVIEENAVTKDLGPKEDETKEEPKLKTTAADSESSEHLAFANETTTITDTVEYADLEIGKEYTFDGYLVVKETGEPLLDADGNKITASQTITVEATEEGFVPTISGSEDERYGAGTVELTFTFDSSLLKGKSVVVFEDLYLEKFHVGVHADINDAGQTVRFTDPKVSTTATDKNTGKHYAPLEEKVTIIDEVAYSDLIPGHAYKVSGVLMDRATEQPLLVDGEQVLSEAEFTPEEPDGSVSLAYTLDSRKLEDVTTVVFETLYYNGREIAAHADIQDEKQEVYFTDVKFKTTMTDDETGGHEGIVNKTTVLTDTVVYTGLIPGREYTVTGTLMDKETGKPLVVNGNRVESTAKFTPETRDGSVDVAFTFDSTAWANKSVVAFETMYQNGKEVGVHADIQDEEQTVRFKEPEIGTRALDNETGSHQAFVNETTTITDTVHYKNLVPGKEYRLSGILMDKATGKKILTGTSAVTAETVFTAEAAEGDVDVEFAFDSSALKGKETVVFETLYYNDREIATHEDLQDKGQTISFTDIQIKTSAADKASGIQTAAPLKRVTVKDTVEYSGLIPGRRYVIKGTLMDKKTGKPLKVNKKAVTASKSFRAKKESGTVEMEFTFDASKLNGKTIVVFEELYYKERLIASHADLDDKAQTVKIVKTEGSTPTSPRTGDMTNILPYLLLLAAAMAGAAWTVFTRKKKASK